MNIATIVTHINAVASRVVEVATVDVGVLNRIGCHGIIVKMDEVAIPVAGGIGGDVSVERQVLDDDVLVTYRDGK